MGRPLRIDIKDGWYHVSSRGHNRQRIFLDERDRGHLLELLEARMAREAALRQAAEVLHEECGK